ncbi:NAD(P)-dependent oxidoreductase [Haliea sp.]|uniref:NAD(P)-dependent oxidoreductase n=1 Tax=Haliea sp. TaxID=1932666 RepID=UPI0035274D7B
MRIALQPNIPGLVDQLQALGHGIEVLIVPSDASLAQQPLAADVLLCTATGSGDLPSLLSACRGLRWIHVLGTGIDNFPLSLVGDAVLTCSRGATATPMAEWVLAMMLCHEKQLPTRWINEPPEAWYLADLGCLEQKNLGLVGLGAIGEAVARRALAFDMQVIAKVRSYRDSPLTGVQLVEHLTELLQAADHVVLALPATPASRGLIDAQALATMKPGAHLINVSRAALVDQDALRLALDSGQLARASLDVVDPEPLPAGHWIYGHPKIRLSAHVSWSGPNMAQRLLAPFIANVQAFIRGEPLQGLVDTQAGY